MKKKLFAKVKDLCKDTGLSEKYLQAITDKMGGSLTDDSTDEDMENVANLIADVAKESQGEATRWANKKKDDSKKKDDQKDDQKDDHKDDQKDDKDDSKTDPNDERIKALEKELADMKAERQKGERSTLIEVAMEKHKIPAKLRARYAKSLSDEEDIDAAVAAIKQDLITEGLVSEDQGGSKAASEKQVDEAADSLLKSITAK